MSHIHWVEWGPGTPNDMDEDNRWEFWVCDGWVCDLEDIGVSSMFRLIRRVSTLVRMWPTLDLICEENTVWRKWKENSTSWTPDVPRKRSVSRYTCKNRGFTISLCRHPDVKVTYQGWYVDLIIRIKPFRLVLGSITDRDNQDEVTVSPGSEYQRTW